MEKIDLTQAEAVLDLIKAKSEKSLETAVRQLSGMLSQKFKSLKDELMKIYAHMEAFLDFPDEDLEIFDDQSFHERFSRVKNDLTCLIGSFKRGAVLREGVSVVIAGKSNVGKSSLFNALLMRDRALVSDFPGTTRDSLEEAIEIGGIYIRLIDSAGLAVNASHPVDKLGMDRTRQALKECDFSLFVTDGSCELEEIDKHIFHEMSSGKPVITIVNKTDLGIRMNLAELKSLTGNEEIIQISALTREGLKNLEAKISDLLIQNFHLSEGEQVTRLRHKNLLEKSKLALERAQEAFAKRTSLEFVVLDLKVAIDELRELIGEIYSEDLLDVIFSEFCIGK